MYGRPSEQRIQVEHLRSNGLSVRQIAQRLGLPRATVGDWCRDLYKWEAADAQACARTDAKLDAAAPGALPPIAPLPAAEPTRVCANPSCLKAGQRQPWSAFYAKTRWPDGTVRQPHSRCKTCMAEATKAWHTRMRLDPQWRKERTAKAYESLAADPERYAIHLDRKREIARRQRRALGIPPRYMADSDAA